MIFKCHSPTGDVYPFDAIGEVSILIRIESNQLNPSPPLLHSKMYPIHHPNILHVLWSSIASVCRLERWEYHTILTLSLARSFAHNIEMILRLWVSTDCQSLQCPWRTNRKISFSIKTKEKQYNSYQFSGIGFESGSVNPVSSDCRCI